MIRVCYEDKTVIFGREAPEDCAVVEASDGGIDPAKVHQILETHKTVALVTPDEEAAFDRFFAHYTRVEAAGGAVFDAQGRLLMIRRRGWWDLPKGHIEPGEEALAAALREVEEETGLGGLHAVQELGATWHFYTLDGRRELKRTRWWRMLYRGAHAPVPQREEGIESAVWCTPCEARLHARESYATIRELVELLIPNE